MGGKNLTAQDAFGDNDVYVVTSLGVGRKDMLKDAEGSLLGVVSNRSCPSQLEATRLAEGSDDEDDVDDPYVWRSETIDGGGCDPQWFAGGECKSWHLASAPRW